MKYIVLPELLCSNTCRFNLHAIVWYTSNLLRYACLGQAEIASSSDNKTAVYALMDKIAFDRERYRLGHTLVFFRAGALAGK